MLAAVAGVILPSQQQRLSLALFAAAVGLSLVTALALIADGLHQRRLRRKAIAKEAHQSLARLEYLPSVTTRTRRLRWRGGRSRVSRTPAPRQVPATSTPAPGQVPATSAPVARVAELQGRPTRQRRATRAPAREDVPGPGSLVFGSEPVAFGTPEVELTGMAAPSEAVGTEIVAAMDQRPRRSADDRDRPDERALLWPFSADHADGDETRERRPA